MDHFFSLHVGSGYQLRPPIPTTLLVLVMGPHSSIEVGAFTLVLIFPSDKVDLRMSPGDI